MTEATTDAGWAEKLMRFETIDPNLFRSHHQLDNRTGAIFGGQPLGQALAAAQRTVPGWRAHSCAGNFLRAGRLDVPIDYAVEAVRDGRRYAARRVVARQAGKPMFDMLCSFHDPEYGPEHQFAEMGDVPAPETLPDLVEFVTAQPDRFSAGARAIYLTPFPIELKLIDAEASLLGGTRSHTNAYWFSIPSARVLDDPGQHQALLAFASDLWLAGAAGAPHSVDWGQRGVTVVSLTHSMWFHAPARADEWLFYRTESPWAGEGRGLVRGMIYGRDGRLVATVVQEVSMRRPGDQR